RALPAALPWAPARWRIPAARGAQPRSWQGVSRHRELEEVGENGAPALAGDRFRVELDAPHRQRAVPESEDLVLPTGLIRPGGDLELGRQRRGVDDERVIPRRHERRVEAAEEVAAAVGNGRQLAVQRASG